ncbi:MAG TPA: DUF1634 domain-containing protein [Candidatus Limnocylindrales bacterium]|nr:DUF1634 domain-containing protein [Candidatus Limnocylindrales bacterium]
MDLEQRVGRLITFGTYLSIGLLVLGVALMATGGRSPLDPPPAFDPASIPGALAAGRPEGFLWLGLIAAIATPSARVVASLVGYVARHEPMMAGISVVILAVIVVGVALGLASGRAVTP